MTYPSNSSAFGIWTLNEVRDAVRGDNWVVSPPIAPDTLSASYTSGTVATVTYSGQVTYGDSPTFTVTSSPDGLTGSGSSPVTIAGLNYDTEYTFTVTVNDIGGSVTSSASNTITTQVSPPTAPTSVTAVAGELEATVTYSGQVTYGDSPTFTVTSSPGGITATGASPVTVTGLTGDVSYTFTVTVDDEGGSDTSSASNSVTIIDPSTHGSLYADSYLATTGGSLITVSSGGNLRSAIDNASDGDAILVDEGTYQLGPKNAAYPASRSLWGTSDVLICGNTDNPANVVLDFNHDEYSEQRDHPVFIGSTASTQTQCAFLTYFRNPDTTISTNYSTALTLPSTTNCFGIAVNCYFDLNNDNVSWHYDNGASSGNDMRFIRCTFANYNNWLASYSGRDDQIDVGSSLFDGATDSTEYVNLGDNYTGVAINNTTRTYNTSTYPTSGHLYIPNTTAIF